MTNRVDGGVHDKPGRHSRTQARAARSSQTLETAISDELSRTCVSVEENRLCPRMRKKANVLSDVF